MLNASLKHLNGTTRTRLLLFDKLVKPILNYDCEVWGNILQLPKNKVNRDEFWKKVDTLPFEKLHLRYRSPLQSHKCGSEGGLGRYPLALCIVKSMMGFWDHIENEEYANSILKDSKTECMSLIEEAGSWFYTLKQIYEIFDMKWSGIKPEKHDQRKLLENMRRSYEEYWKNSIGKHGNGSVKLSTYRQIKIGFRKEKYLDSIRFFRESRISPNQTQNKVPMHRLEIETYRYGKKPIPRNERLCSLCIPDRLIHIGDEFHAMIRGIPPTRYAK